MYLNLFAYNIVEYLSYNTDRTIMPFNCSLKEGSVVFCKMCEILNWKQISLSWHCSSYTVRLITKQQLFVQYFFQIFLVRKVSWGDKWPYLSGLRRGENIPYSWVTLACCCCLNPFLLLNHTSLLFSLTSSFYMLCSLPVVQSLLLLLLWAPSAFHVFLQSSYVPVNIYLCLWKF